MTCKCVEIPVATESLKEFRKHQIADHQRFIAEHSIERFSLRRADTPKVIDPNTGIDKDQRSVLISSRLPLQTSLPRAFRISSWFLRRNRIRRPSSTASRFVFIPVVRKTSRISLSSITMFVRTACMPMKRYTYHQHAARDACFPLTRSIPSQSNSSIRAD